MSEMLHLLLAALGIISGLDIVALSGATALAAVVVVLAAALLVAAVTLDPAAAGTSPPHPRRAIGVSVPLPQSDPDAPGHPRPRAPQFVAPAT